MDAILIDLGVLVLSFALAGLLITRDKSKLGIVLGLIPIAIMELWLQSTQITLTQQCINAHCTSAALPPGCTYGRDACAEEIGLRVIVFWGAGFIDLILYAIGVILLFVIHSRRRKVDAARSSPSADGVS